MFAVLRTLLSRSKISLGQQPNKDLATTTSLARGDHPNSRKKRSENEGANENLSCGCPSIPRIAPGVAPRIVAFILLKSWMPFREWNFAFREWNFEFRVLLRECPGTLRELREWPFHSESVFPEIGVVTRLLNKGLLAICAKAFRPPKSPETTPNPKFSRKSGFAPKSSKNFH